ncbi:MAG: cell division protein FtsH [Chloroflexi bacterium]|nr:MAG: cell division protein FtsH [Chloroflexota bacterium]HEY67741.1 ATP-dependent metallopeptidase FtsH/Yme1/Tma family protein [Thermoflexia bacterium]
MNSKSRGSPFIYLIILTAAVFLVYSFYSQRTPSVSQMKLSEVAAHIRAGNVTSIRVEGDDLLVKLKDGGEVGSHKGSESTVTEQLRDLGVTEEELANIEIEVAQPPDWMTLLSAGGSILLVVAMLVGGYLMLRQFQGANNQALAFGKSRARMYTGDQPSVTFDDVAGVDEAKEELREVVEFLKEPEKFVQLGARIPKGVLLVGAPGTGKTLLAKAVSGEAGVPFFSISGSEFVEMFVGVGASRVRDLFNQAKRHSPCIVFLDEIDAVGRHRGAGLGGSHDEREQTLNQILVEMDGFDTDTNVIIMAATNRPDILDPALLRPGRFDRRIVLDRPDIRGREAILKVHVRGKPLGEDVDLTTLAKSTPGFVGADIENLVNEAAILAARRNKKVIEMAEFEEAIERVIAGPERKSRLISDEEKRITAYHEAGHAVVAHVLPKCDPVHKVSIVARGIASGYTMALPEEDRRIVSKAKFRDDLAFALGGRAAEELVFGDVTTGAANDLERVTEMARAMVTRYGMSERLGPMTFGQKEELVFLGKEIGEQRDYSEAVAQEIDQEVRKIVHEAYERAKEVLTRYREQLDRIAERLIEVETLEADEFVALFEGAPRKDPKAPESPPPVPDVKRPDVQPVPKRRKPRLDMPPAPAPA